MTMGDRRGMSEYEQVHLSVEIACEKFSQQVAETILCNLTQEQMTRLVQSALDTHLSLARSLDDDNTAPLVEMRSWKNVREHLEDYWEDIVKMFEGHASIMLNFFLEQRELFRRNNISDDDVDMVRMNRQIAYNKALLAVASELQRRYGA